MWKNRYQNKDFFSIFEVIDSIFFHFYAMNYRNFTEIEAADVVLIISYFTCLSLFYMWRFVWFDTIYAI